MIIVVNDSSKKLFVWEHKLGSNFLAGYSTLNDLLDDLANERVPRLSKGAIFLIDRYYYGADINLETFSKIKKLAPEDSKFFLTSAAHNENDEFHNFDKVLDGKTLTYKELVEKISGF